jgi:CRP-like cAMP-binding protein
MSLGADIYGVVYEKGEIICREGDPGECMYIIQSGAVEISRQNGSQEVVLAMLEQGDFFGEMALLDQQPRSATVKTMSRTRLLPLTRDSFLGRAHEDPEISLHLIKALSQRIDKTSRLLRQKIEGEEELSHPTADEAADLRGEEGQTGSPRTNVDRQRAGEAVSDLSRIGLIWEKSLKDKTESFSDTLYPGYWNKVELVISPAKEDELGHLKLSSMMRN